MKAKFLLALVACLALPLFAGCGMDNSDGYSDISIYAKDDYTSYFQTDDISADAEDISTEDTSEVTVMYVTINSNKLKVELAQNTSVDALVEILKQNDIVYMADDYGNFEKVGSIGHSLPRNDENITTEAGDVILYQGSSICLYYGTNTWSFTRIGKINGYTTAELKSLLGAGSGSVEVTLSLD